jgi:hypothetical protein
MLRRNSRHRQRRPLSRSKSAYSIIRNPVDRLESIDPATARRDAHIAATLSYQRANGGPVPMAQLVARSEDNACLEPRLSRFVNASSGQIQADEPSPEAGFTAPSSDMQRQQSVRFSGPKAHLKRNLAPRASKYRSSSGGHEGDAAPVASGQTLKGIAEVHRKAFGFHSLTRNYLRSLKAVDTDDTGGEDASVAGPRQRKLRKSRSMFTGLGASDDGYYFSNDTPPQLGQIRRSRSRYAALNAHAEKPKPVWALNHSSYPFPGAETIVTRPISQPSKDLALQLAREKSQQQVEHQHHHPLKPQSSLFLRSRNKRSESSMALRKSLRNSSNTSGALSSAFSGYSLAQPKQLGLRKTARRVSQSLRSRVKGLFNRTKLGDEFSHFQDREAVESQDGAGSGFDEEATPVGEASMSCVASHIPSLHAVPSFQQMQSRKGSVESLGGSADQFADEKSRVTSWTNSVTNTLPSQSAAGEWERQRLSVIKENGTHTSSSSRSKPTQGLSPEIAVDSERVYAALMKRLEGTPGQQDQRIEQSVNGMMKHSVAPTRDYSAEQVDAPTIRCVTSDDDVFSDDRTPRGMRSEDPLLSSGAVLGSESVSEAVISFAPGKTMHNSSHSPKSKTVSHRSSAFFGSPATHLFRTTSPYRRALQQEMQKPDPTTAAHDPSHYLSTMSPIVLPPRRPSTIGSENWQQKASEGSLYSNKDEETSDNPWSMGDAIVDHFPKPPKAGASLARQEVRDVSAVSSIEWQRWLSSDVAKGEESTRSLIGRGHVREQAEIDPQAGRLNMDTSRDGWVAPGTPLRPIQSNSRSSSALKIPPNTWEQGTHKAENGRPSPSSYVAQKTPPIPARSALRAIPSKPKPKEAETCERHQQQDSPEHSPLLVPARSTGSCGPSTRVGHRQRSRLDNVMTLSPQPHPLPWPLNEPKRPSTASPGHRTNWALDKTLQRLHVRDITGRLEPVNQTESRFDSDSRVMGSKRMVDRFLSSRRKKTHEARSRSTGHSSPAFL